MPSAFRALPAAAAALAAAVLCGRPGAAAGEPTCASQDCAAGGGDAAALLQRSLQQLQAGGLAFSADLEGDRVARAGRSSSCPDFTAEIRLPKKMKSKIEPKVDEMNANLSASLANMTADLSDRLPSWSYVLIGNDTNDTDDALEAGDASGRDCNLTVTLTFEVYNLTGLDCLRFMYIGKKPSNVTPVHDFGDGVDMDLVGTVGWTAPITATASMTKTTATTCSTFSTVKNKTKSVTMNLAGVVGAMDMELSITPTYSLKGIKVKGGVDSMAVTDGGLYLDNCAIVEARNSSGPNRTRPNRTRPDRRGRHGGGSLLQPMFGAANGTANDTNGTGFRPGDVLRALNDTVWSCNLTGMNDKLADLNTQVLDTVNGNLSDKFPQTKTKYPINVEAYIEGLYDEIADWFKDNTCVEYLLNADFDGLYNCLF